ncbi:hypothetical protein LU699_13220 [Luteimonas fraxinea]|uniref:Uncharacterized protein n=1 Tax=Luteimonas fraxinea TaxID=2901869 RepID=A0ABS8UEV2_9GAMM|nr:hypothetical protein [Luteimonas fraxinea]MCD9098025.1 hypothetical protein [Luteimonas fraxinea]UHH09248.1 hypothetical protein LU699_13220 [Luteimonas fraxinea]
MFKLARWIITAAALLWLWNRVTGEGITSQGTLLMTMVYGQFVFWPLLVLWIVPAIFRHRPPKAKKHDLSVFSAGISHDHIALDQERDKLWIRDPARGERYLDRNDILSIRTAFDVRGSVTNQRLELQVRDVEHPLWQVPFVRHSDRRHKGMERNGAERDEWFARLKAWTGLSTVR